jgi:phosphoribosylformimino-5-aminoimidazole carboxamide ribotide isomerase
MRAGPAYTAQTAMLQRSGGYRHFRLVGERSRGRLRAAELAVAQLWQPGWQPLPARRPMQVIPAIDLLDGQCVRLHQGDYDRVTRFSDDPVAQALSWQSQGAERLHLVDLDGARTGEPVNDTVIKAITGALAIPVQLGGGVRTAERAAELLACGLDRVILGTVALEQPALAEQLAERHPGRIVVGIDARNGKVATRGWIAESSTEATALARRFSCSPLAALICTDIATDGTLAGPNLAFLRAMAEASSVPVIASGGIGDLADLLSLLPLEALGVAGVIVGRALYDGRVDLAEALQAVGDGRLQDAAPKPASGSLA